MPDNRGTFIEELVMAGRGVVALFLGDRKAATYFDFSRRGLGGSFIALLLTVGIVAGLPVLMGLPREPGSITQFAVSTALTYGSQMGFAALLLRQVNRLDALRAYLVCVNWVNAYLVVLIVATMLLQINASISLLFFVVIGFVLQINIARVIVTLTALQIVMLLVAQFVGVLLALLAIGVIYPLSPAELEAIAASSQPG